jgi:hypothetical protein
VTQLVLPLHEVVAKPLHADVESAAKAAAESATEPLHADVDPAATGAALTETSCLCVRV